MSKKNIRTAPIKKFVLEPGEQLVLGIDTHKNSYHCALWSSKREGLVDKWVQPSDATALVNKLHPLADHIAMSYYEAGPTGFELARHLKQHGFVVTVIAPSHTPQAKHGQAKCDRLDACRLAEYGAKGLLKPVRIPTRKEERERQLVRTRRQIVKKRSCAKVQIRSFLLYYGIAEPEGLKNWSKVAVEVLRALELAEELRLSLDLLLGELDHHNAQLKRIEQRMDKMAQESELAEKVELLCTLPYFGQMTSLTFVTEMREPERFKTAREVSSFQALAPRVEASGESRKEKGLGKEGSRVLRTALVEAAWRWVTHDTKAAILYKHYLVRTGMKQKAIVAVARRLGIIAWQMLLTNTVYDPTRLPERAARS